MALHDLWDIEKSWCMTALFFYRAVSASLKFCSLNTVCVTVDSFCLNTKTAKKKKENKTIVHVWPTAPSIISTVDVIPGQRLPTMLAGLQRVCGAQQNHPRARFDRLLPQGLQWQQWGLSLWDKRLCSHCHCLSHCLHHLQQQTKDTIGEHITFTK